MGSKFTEFPQSSHNFEMMNNYTYCKMNRPIDVNLTEKLRVEDKNKILITIFSYLQ